MRNIQRKIKSELISCDLYRDSECKKVGKALLLSHEVQRRPPYFLNSCQSPGGDGSTPSLRLGQWFISKDIMSIIAA